MGIFRDIIDYEKRKIDEDRLIRDKINLDRDLAEGDILGTLYEEEKLRYDRRNLDRDIYDDRFSRNDSIFREEERLRENRFIEREMIEEDILFDEERRMRDRFVEDELIEDAEDFIDDFRL